MKQEDERNRAPNAKSRADRRRSDARQGWLLLVCLAGCAAVPPAPPPPGLDGVRPGLWRFEATGPSWGLDAIPTNLSGITYSPDADAWFLVQNDDAVVYEYEPDLLTLRRRLKLKHSPDDDFEGIAHLGGRKFALVNEANHIFLVEFPEGTSDVSVSLDPDSDDVQWFRLPGPESWNGGFEAVCFDPELGERGSLYVLQEKGPRGIFRVVLPAGNGDVDARNGSDALAIEVPFDAESALAGVASDLSGCAWDASTGHLLIVSHASSKLIEVALDGQVVHERPLPGVFHGGAGQYEGVALGPPGTLALASEPLFGSSPSRVMLLRLPF